MLQEALIREKCGTRWRAQMVGWIGSSIAVGLLMEISIASAIAQPPSPAPAKALPAKAVPAKAVPEKSVPARTVPAQAVPAEQADVPAKKLAPAPLATPVAKRPAGDKEAGNEQPKGKEKAEDKAKVEKAEAGRAEPAIQTIPALRLAPAAKMVPAQRLAAPAAVKEEVPKKVPAANDHPAQPARDQDAATVLRVLSLMLGVPVQEPVKPEPAAPAIAMIQIEGGAAAVEGFIIEGGIIEGAAAVDIQAAMPAEVEQGVLIVGRAEAVAPDANAEAAPIDPIVAMENQFFVQLRPIIASELYFAKKTCSLTGEEYAKVLEAGMAGAREAAAQITAVQQRMQRGPFRPDDPPVFPDAREVIAARIAKSIDEGIEDSRAKLYRDELERRSAFRKKTAVRALVNRLDQQLILAQEQRDQIAASLMEHYRETWGRQLEYLVYDHYRPNILDEWIVPHLNDNQRSVWQLSKNNSVSYFGWSNPGAMINENNWEINLPPLPAVAAEPAGGVLVEAAETVEAQPAQKRDDAGQDQKQDVEGDKKAKREKKNEQPERDESKAERNTGARDNVPAKESPTP